MRKGIIALALEALLFWCFFSLWNPIFENQREQERREAILNSVTTDICKQGLCSYLNTCEGLQNPIVHSMKLVSKEFGNSNVHCKMNGEIDFSYNGKTYNGTFTTDGSSDSITSENIVNNISFFDGIYIRDRKNNFSLRYDCFGHIIVEQLKIGESITIDGIRCVFERKWESGDWYMKTSKMLTPTQMYRLFSNPKWYNPNGIRFSTEKFLLYGVVTSGQIFVSKGNGIVYRYAADIDDNNKVKLRRID